MKPIVGRHIFVTSLASILEDSDIDSVVQKSVSAHFSGVWFRLGRGKNLDHNFEIPKFPDLQKALRAAGVELWGWHVPFCHNGAAAETEAKNVLSWVDKFQLPGLVLDIERTSENPRFQGGAAEAIKYIDMIAAGLLPDQALGFSSHDQPQVHKDLPFDVILPRVVDICPQVYYQSTAVAQRFNKSVAGYKALVGSTSFPSRFKPTGNITVGSDIGLPNAETCLTATKNFLQLVKDGAYKAHSFWCWDDAPDEVFPLLASIPV
jgi:hypothetical protein